MKPADGGTKRRRHRSSAVQVTVDTMGWACAPVLAGVLRPLCWRELMPVQRSLIRFGALRLALALMIALASLDAWAGDSARPIAVPLSFARPLDASMAPFVLAASHGLFNAEGVAVTTATAKGTTDAIARVASG